MGTTGRTTLSARLYALADRIGARGAFLATLAVLVVVFYYPVGTVLVAAFSDDGALSLAPLWATLTDPFYFGVLSGVIADPASAPGALVGWVEAGFPAVRTGLFGFTAYLAVLGTACAVLVGLPGAYVLARYEFRGRETIRSLTVVPFVLPAIMVAVGFTTMFGTHGTLNDLLSVVGLRIDVAFSLPLVVAALTFYNAPLVTRFVVAAADTVDARAVETARTLGAPRWRAFLDVVAPQLLPSFLASVLLVFVFDFMAFPIVLALGGLRLATVEVWIYSLAANLDLGEAAALAVLEATVTLGVTYLYLRYERRGGSGTAGARVERVPLIGPPSLGRLLAAAYAVVAAVLYVGPLASMVAESLTRAGGFSLANYAFLLAQQLGTGGARPTVAVQNSLLFAVGAVALAVPMGVSIAVVTNRSGRLARVGGALLMAPLAVSGVVTGIGLLQGLVFGVDVLGHHIAVTGPVAIVAAHAVGGYPFVVRNVAPLLARVDDDLVAAARTLGAGPARAFRDVTLPLVAPGVVAGAAFAFAISVGEFNATIVLARDTASYTMPVALERYLSNPSVGPYLGPAAAMGTVLLCVTAMSFVVVERLGGRWEP
ncbi:iron ABC transporter permease [Halarchaeum sp. CBA1220]|uniref:ABC transporter permease n=1 Tax=Halarchaeum sp. CBA1220 TaxID=1853682 RepID=UPI000F3AA040|nr:iron ABC transporter permease [Halarchaeum sp. CBA1220]QLC33393.1 iron ABC transporter permease [Halarchaeum sp. CBA1220]